MKYIQVSPYDDSTSILDVDVAYPDKAWGVMKPLLEKQGYIFLPLDGEDLPGTYYDRDKGEFYTPTFETPEPTEVEALQAQVTDLSHKMDRQSTILMNLGMALMPPPEVPDTPPDLPPVPPAGTLPSAEDLKGMMDGTTPPDLPTP